MRLAMEVAGKNISIIGAAKSGLSAARSLARCGAKVFVSDIQSEDKLKASLEREHLLDCVDYEAGGHTEKVLHSDFIVLSPGVRTDIPVLIEAAARKIPVYSEIEIAYRLSRGRRLVITGSNGKTTTTTLLAEFCRKQFEEVFLGGNIGIPIMEFATETTDRSLQVLEVSSFQLETISEFKPDIAVITNFFENHLDRYPSYNAYIEAKKRIALNMHSSETIVLNADQQLMREMADELDCQKAWFGWQVGDLKPSMTVIDEEFVYTDRDGKRQKLFPTSSVRIIGRHNLENVMCAALVAILAGVSGNRLESVVTRFPGVEHRLEWAGEVGGVTFINDSKGTNCAASITALQACKPPMLLLAGGRDKGTDLADWVAAVRTRSRGVVLFGEARARFRSALEGLVPLKMATTLEQALATAYQWTEPGDTILLSPACSSYDQFPNFEVRGETFKQLVKALAPK
ncbi:MAG: UDP-N-acetylmuramoyl-L-alanine--D-glutamate ligase [Candidatus Riflebacteria bacterium HGW-Riflebacteria-2]|jgi:UDP-N-acetylmuramoylalanine--D-glutamate ligase|nr:MAG: UDP-N-acetylmuramoyl-L-alanine--D-glutamate ligase [Candidatus Riflebacteria bacterium HGW-Riflebacteria-2]